MAQIFTVTCPACGGQFPCHPELWQVAYDLLCPFCQTSFPQEESPLIITGTGERRPGSRARIDGKAAGASAGAPEGAPERPGERPVPPIDPNASAESM